jgi:hypothetical protein
MFGLGKKKVPANAPAAPGAAPAPPPEAPAAPTGTPVEQVTTMQKQGMSNYQIVQTLQQQGYSSQQVYDAINQASVKSGVNQAPAEGMPPTAGGMPPAPPGGPPPGPAPASAPMPPPAPAAAQGIEETVEAIVDEKWKEVSEAFTKLNEWRDSTDTKINKIQQSMNDLKSDMDNLHKAIVAKIGEYDQNILNVGTEIKAMEKVFSKVLPTFTENVNELARVAKGMKPKKK